MMQQATKWDLAPFFRVASCVASSVHGAYVSAVRDLLGQCADVLEAGDGEARRRVIASLVQHLRHLTRQVTR